MEEPLGLVETASSAAQSRKLERQVSLPEGCVEGSHVSHLDGAQKTGDPHQPQHHRQGLMSRRGAACQALVDTRVDDVPPSPGLLIISSFLIQPSMSLWGVWGRHPDHQGAETHQTCALDGGGLGSRLGPPI